MLSLLVLAGLFATAAAKSCVGFDANWGLYVFGLEHDVSLGPVAAWSANPVGTSTLTKTGRPPFNGPNTQCFFSQYQNALYVLNADTTQPSNIHIFSFETQSWSTQQVAADGTDPNSFLAILDRNTNVFFALSKSQLYSLDMGTLSQADGSTRGWQFVQAPAFAQNNAYPKPVMALAQNHIHFLNTGTAGLVDVFVIHFSYMQPDPQPFFPIEGGGGAPSTTGQTASIFKGPDEVQTKFAFVPDDGSSTFVFDVISNTTQTLKGPSDKSTLMIAASQHEIVQMTKSGDVYWMPYSPEDAQANYGASWNKIALNLAPHVTAVEELSSNPTSLSPSSPRPTSTGTASTSRSSASRLSAIWHSGVAALGLSLTGLWILS